LEAFWVAGCEVRTLTRIAGDIEQVVMLVDAQVLPIPIPEGPLVAMLHAPVHGSCKGAFWVLQNRQERHAVERVPRMGRHARGSQHRRRPVHGHAMLSTDRAGLYERRPMCDPWHADASLREVHLASHQRPVVGE